MEQQIRFCTTSDGVRIAYATYGPALGHPLVVVGSWFGWEEVWKQFRDWFERIGRDRRLVTIDGRGVGASERDPERVELDDRVHDVETVVDQLDLPIFDLLAAPAQVSMRFASTHPGRVSRLVLWSASAKAITASFSYESIESAWGVYTRALGTMAFLAVRLRCSDGAPTR